MRRAPAVRKASAAIGGAARWKGSTAEERTAIMTAMAKRPRGPRRKIEDRCACGRTRASWRSGASISARLAAASYFTRATLTETNIRT